MTAYIIRRLMQSAAVVFAMSVIVFLGLNVIGDPVYLLIDPQADQAEIERPMRLGLDQPIHIQYPSFVTNALKSVSALRPWYLRAQADRRARSGDARNCYRGNVDVDPLQYPARPVRGPEAR